jgi:hypothetical protein
MNSNAELIETKFNLERGIDMAFEGQNECAVYECGNPCSEFANLCEEHAVPGVVFGIGHGTCVVTSWYAEHLNEAGIIGMNDFALGDLFGGAAGFKAKLERQGFSQVRNLRTPEELEAAKARVARAPGKWSGPWLTTYPWET